jgi:steroid 5-alpha reductase family enzyme
MKLARLLLFVAIIGLSIFLFTNNLPFYWGVTATMSALTALWLVSLVVKDASIIDIFWGLGFVLSAWVYRYILSSHSDRTLIICILVSIWGIRLAAYLANRNLGKGEDYRYQVWRKEYGINFWWVSYFRVFLLQGVLLWLIGAPLLVAQTTDVLSVFDYLGIILWAIGLTFETVGDYQLAQFKKNSDNKGKVLDSGLWKYTRHPNYFGDAVLWWGLFCFAASAGGWWTVFSPVLMTFLLMKVSGVALLEKTLVETKPQYKDYIRRTSAFFPMMPK